MNSVSSKTSDKDFCYILSKAWTLLLTIQYFLPPDLFCMRPIPDGAQI